MAQFTCTQCGSRMEVSKESRIGQCPVCGALFILPNHLEKKQNIYRLAGEALAACNFEMAQTFYSRILKVDATEMAAHWGYLLAKFGIEISRRPETFDQIIFHRLEHSSFMADPSYEKMIMYCPREVRYYYEGLSRQIEEKHNRMLEIFRTIPAYDICLNCVDSSVCEDYLLANQVGKALDDAGYRVFLPCTMLDHVPQEDYNLYEMAAAEKSEAMLVVISPGTNQKNSRYRALWQRFLAYHRQDAEKKLLSVYKNMRPEQLPLELQSLQSIDCNGTDFLNSVLLQINKMFGRQGKSSLVTREILDALRQGQELLEDRDWKQARTAYLHVLELDPEEAQAHWGLVCADTQGLTRPVLSGELDSNFQQALKFSQPGRKQSYQKKMQALMREKVWDALKKTTKDLQDTSVDGSEDVKEAIRRVYLYLPPDDERLQEIETYHKRARLNTEVKALKTAYDRRDTAVQPLFAEQKKAENAYSEIRIPVGDFYMEHGLLVFITAVSLLCLLISQVVILYHFRLETGYTTGMYKAAKYFFWAGFFLFDFWLCLFLDIISEFKYEDAVSVLFFVLPIGLRFLYNRYMRQVTFVVLFVLLAVFLAERIAVVVSSKGAREAVGRIRKAEQEIKRVDAQLLLAYQEQMNEVLARYDGLSHEIPPFKATHSKGFAWRKLPYVVQPTPYILNTVLFYAVITISVTAISNVLYTRNWNHIVDLAPGEYHVLGLRDDGTVVSAGSNRFGEGDVGDWQDVIQIAAGMEFSAGLKSDGSVYVAAAEKSAVQAASEWTDIVQLSASYYHLVGLKSDGTVVAAGKNDYSECEVEDFSDVEKIYAVINVEDLCTGETFAITKDGRILLAAKQEDTEARKSWLEDYTGSNEGQRFAVDIYGKYDMNQIRFQDGSSQGIGYNYYNNLEQASAWDLNEVTDIFSGEFSLGLKADGTVLFAGNNNAIAQESSTWQDAAAITGQRSHALVLHEDGTVSAVGDNSRGKCDTEGWKNITAIYASELCSYGICGDGTVETAGNGYAGATYLKPKSPVGLVKFWLDSWNC